MAHGQPPIGESSEVSRPNPRHQLKL
jgi:hypothetical protein